MSVEAILKFVVESVKAEAARAREKEREAEDPTRPVTPNGWWAVVEAGTLVEPARKKGTHHRSREEHYTAKLEEAEKELREKGVSVDVFDSNTGSYLSVPYGHIASGAIGSGQIGSIGSFCSGAMPSLTGSLNPNQHTFQPRLDQRLLDVVKNMKNKMLDHRSKADQYEKYVRAYALDPTRKVRLTVEDVHYFGLEG